MLHLHLHHATSLLAVFAQDTDQQTRAIGGLMAGMMGFIMLFMAAIYAFFAFLFWRIFVKAGMAGPLGLIALFPGFGFIIALCILAFAEWKVVPAPTASAYLPPSYPPPPPAFQPPTQM